MYKIVVIFLVLPGFLLVSSQGLSGRNYMEKQLLCALEQGPCDVVGSQIKNALPEIIGNNCRACDPRQRVNAKRMANIIQGKYPEVWDALLEKYSVPQ